ncbi:uncharacterized protein L201_004583 [Kwoniella dendrophila CBS 6074]|uniref:Uncharacterized protein n=1 Tax=Kwoniella dendrophila CBS 6074 TaxID=1295534 RepID=A0AAX4JXR3_9TREE
MEGRPMISLHPIWVQLATIPAVAIASYKALNVWRAVSALPLNPHSSSQGANQSNPSAFSECARKWRSLTATKKAKKVAAFCIVFTISIGLNMFVVFGLPRISSQSVLDGIWCTPMLLLFTSSIRYTSDIAIPTPRSVRYHQSKPEGPTMIAFNFEGEKKTILKIEIFRQLVSLVTAMGIFYSTYLGYTYFHPLLGAAYIISCISTVRLPKMSIRRIIQVMSAYLAVTPVLSIVIGVVTSHFTGDDDKKEDNSDKNDDFTIASDWILSLMFIMANVFGAMIPSIITAMTLRFEYSLVNEPTQRSTELSTEAPIQIPNEYPSFPKPIFISSLLSLLLSQVVIEGITYIFPYMVWLSITPITIFITVPIVFGGTALGAAWCGKFNQWWRYTEVWIPAKKATAASNDNTKDLDEAEVALLSSEEKSNA